MKKIAGNTCQRCEKSFHPSELDVHHRTYERLGHELPSDLQVLCRVTCHPIGDAIRADQTQMRRQEKRNAAASDTYLSKRVGENYQSVADEGMYEEAECWRDKKHYGEFGE